MSVLYVVATPIGNLEDLTHRALRILSEVDLILCEDTRVTKKLLDSYGVKKPLLSYHQHSRLEKINYILGLLKSGKNLALVSDAGAPGISDPGNLLIKELISQLKEEIKIIPIPGTSAITVAASISGFPMDRFLFLGFPPAKNKRNKFFSEVANSNYPVIFYESPYRIIKTLKDLQSVISNLQSSVDVVVCRELTKKFETIYRGTIEEVITEIGRNPIKGEFTVIVKSK